MQNFVALMAADLDALESQASQLDEEGLAAGLFKLLRGHPEERAAALPLVEARMDERTRRVTFRQMVRKRIAAILRARTAGMSADQARDMAVVILQLMKSASALSDEEGLPGRSAGMRELQMLTAHYLKQRS